MSGIINVFMFEEFRLPGKPSKRDLEKRTSVQSLWLTEISPPLTNTVPKQPRPRPPFISISDLKTLNIFGPFPAVQLELTFQAVPKAFGIPDLLYLV